MGAPRRRTWLRASDEWWVEFERICRHNDVTMEQALGNYVRKSVERGAL